MDIERLSYLCRTEECDWLVANVLSLTQTREKQSLIFERAFVVSLANIVAVSDLANEDIDVDIISLVMEMYQQVKSTINVETSYVKFIEYHQWIKSGKPTNQPLTEYHTLLLLRLLETHVDCTHHKTFYYEQLNLIKSNFKQATSDSNNNNNTLSLWINALLLFFQARAIEIDMESKKKAAQTILQRALDNMERVVGEMTHGGGQRGGVSVVDKFFLDRCYYCLARVKSLLGDVNGCFYYLTKAKINNEFPSVEAVKTNRDFHQLSSNYLFLEIINESNEFSQQRNAFNLDRNNFSGNVSLTLAQSVTASQLMHRALTTSTLDFLVQQKLPLAINLHEFFQPIVNTAHREAEARLKERMTLYGLCAKRQIPGDGNCQMHSLSDQLCGNLKHSKFIRRSLVSWLRNNADLELSNGCSLKDFVHDQSWDQYCTKMSKEGEWGDHLTLISAAELFNISVTIVSSIPGDNFVIEVVPVRCVPLCSITLSHFAEFHYGSIHPIS